MRQNEELMGLVQLEDEIRIQCDELLMYASKQRLIFPKMNKFAFKRSLLSVSSRAFKESLKVDIMTVCASSISSAS